MNENNFFEDNFTAFNFPCENQGSFTVKIEDSMAASWNDALTFLLGNPQVKTNGRGTETDRFWKLNYEFKKNIEITVHLYNKPKNKSGSKLLIQGSDQSAICSYVFNELPQIYKKISRRN